MSKTNLSSADFELATFPYIVLKLRESCLAGTAHPQEVDDWRILATWLGCADQPVTSAHITRLTEARLAFLRHTNGSDFEAAKLPAPEICDIFERLSPSAPAIEKMKAQAKTQTAAAAPPAGGLSMETGCVTGGVIVLIVLMVMRFPYGNPDPGLIGEAFGSAVLPAVIAAFLTRLIRGRRAFSPMLDGFIIAAITCGLGVLAAAGSLSSHEDATDKVATAAAAVNLLSAIVGALPIWLVTALVTWLMSRGKKPSSL